MAVSDFTYMQIPKQPEVICCVILLSIRRNQDAGELRPWI